MIAKLRTLRNRISSLPLHLLFITTPPKLERRPEASAVELWFGLKAYVESDIIAVKVLGWVAVVTLVTSILLASCLAAFRLVTLWDYWFEEIRRPDLESGVHRFLRILSFWLAVLGFAAWAGCSLLS